LSSDIETKDIKIYTPVEADFSLPSTLIETSTAFKFTDSSTGDVEAYLWDFGDGTTSTRQNPAHSYHSAGDYSVSLTVSNELSSDSKTIQIQALEKAVPSFHATVVDVKPGDVIHFTDDSTGEITEWLWDFGDGDTSTEQNPEHVYDNDGFYTVTLTVSNPAGSNSAVMEDYITVGSLDITLVMCSQVTDYGEYTPQPGAVFHEGDPILLYMEISGFDQNIVPGGFEVWIETQSIVVAEKDGGFVHIWDNPPEIHETNPAQAISIWAGLSLLPFYFPSEYEVRIVVVDKISGKIGIGTITYTIE
jgi:PKD repeat protein